MEQEYERGDLVVLGESWSGKNAVYLVQRIDRQRERYLTISLANRNTTMVPFRAVVGKIGTFSGDIDDPFSVLARLADAESVISGSDDEAGKWKFLNTLKQNDPVPIRRSNGKIEVWRFERRLPKGRRFVFAARRASGTCYKFPITALQVPAAPTATV